MKFRVPNPLRLAIVAVAAVMVFSAAPSVADENANLAAANPKDPHADVLSKEAYPSASQCAVCHKQIYKEWASSNHAYASISPMFHKFENAVNVLTQGTMGSFCVRCHQQVGTQRGEPRHLPLWERSRVSSEGITCITCHRVQEEYGRVNGERSLTPGNIYQPVFGTLKGSQFDKVIKNKDDYKISAKETERGAKIHVKVKRFAQISKSEFCVSCHQVAVNLGIKLEVVWEQYRDSPAAKKGVTCQECHMGKVPGVAAGYTTAPVAIVDGKEINPGRKHSNHAFYGPGYPIAHPGIFPHNPEAETWTMQEWLQFDYRAGWGTEAFEESVEDLAEIFETVDEAVASLKDGDNSARGDLEEQLGELKEAMADRKEPRFVKALAGYEKAVKGKADAKATTAAVELLKKTLGINFPEAWADAGDREDANEVIQENLEALEEKKELRKQVMENGSRVDGPFFSGTPTAGDSLSFRYRITNTDDGHNLPSGSLGAQPEIWFNVALIDPDGKRVWESGYVDKNGDFADIHSLELAAGNIEYDDQLVNLQTKFLTTNVKGTDREMYLPVNFDIDQRPLLRPVNVPASVLNHPPFARMEGRSIPPLGHRDAKYKIPAELMKKKGKYKLASRLRSRAEPIYFMRFVGATPEMEQSMNQWMLDFHAYTVEFEVK
ncbi:MAG: multiheme c-type cytochrome [Rhodospirillaceae bacterium]|nr:multiheme c-type cytochrome [Rhodospirillaceae bacterium]